MFDSLKKKLKEAVEKVSKTIKEERKEEKREERKEEKHQQEMQKTEEKEHAYIDIVPQKREEIQEEERQTVEEEKENLEKEVVKEYVEEKAVEDALEELPAEASMKEIQEKIQEELGPEEKPKEKKGIFQRLFETTLDKKDVDIVLKELKFVLLENDVAIEVVEKICSDVENELVDKSVRRDKIENAIKDALRSAMTDVMQQDKIDIEESIRSKDGVYTVLFLGFNGVGKTTTLAKFAKKLHKYHPIVAAADTFRAASIEQIEEHSKRLGFRVVKHNYGADSAAVIYDAKKAALAQGTKLVLADTAGRSHSNVNLMDELKKVCRVINPDLKILVLDSVTGNDIYEQSRLFNDAVGVDAIILTKADVYDKGGAALSTTYTIKKPILYLGVGQEYDDLKEFDAQEIIAGLLK